MFKKQKLKTREREIIEKKNGFNVDIYRLNYPFGRKSSPVKVLLKSREFRTRYVDKKRSRR